jgi:hypothetical protein
MAVIASYARIYQHIELDWGRVTLQKFLSELMADTRDNQRQGFPKEVADALMSLFLVHATLLEQQGVDTSKGAGMEFEPNVWQIPKDF